MASKEAMASLDAIFLVFLLLVNIFNKYLLIIKNIVKLYHKG